MSEAAKAELIEEDSKSSDSPESIIVFIDIVIVGIGREACLWKMVEQKKQKQFEDGVVLVERTKLCDENADADEAEAEDNAETVNSRLSLTRLVPEVVVSSQTFSPTTDKKPR